MGQGSIEWPDCDWNAIGLWRLKQELTSEVNKKGNVATTDLNNLVNELTTYAEGFLKGDLSLFYKLRKEQNMNRDPYKIYRPTEDGGRELIIDEASRKLKERYS